MRSNRDVIGIIGVAVSLIGIILTLTIYFMDVRKKLVQLIERENGVLTQVQAESLADLYSVCIKNELEASLSTFLQTDFLKSIPNKNFASLDNFVEYAGMDAVKNARNRVAAFNVRGGVSFKAIVESVSPIDGIIIEEAKSKGRKVLADAIANGNCNPEKIYTLKKCVMNHILKANEITNRKIKDYIQQVYQ